MNTIARAGFVAVAVLAGCGEKKQRDSAPIVREEEIAAIVPEPAPAVEPEPSVTVDSIVAAQPTAKTECIDDSKVLSWDPAKLRACFDSNEDGEPDRCVTWRRDGKVASIDTEFAVEDSDAKEPPEPPVEFRSDIDNNEDERITLDGNSIEICPYDRTCMRMSPKLDDGEVSTAFTDRDYKRGVFLVKDFNGAKATLEFWDLGAGRLKARAPMKRLLEDESYEFSVWMGSGAVIGLANDSNSRALGTIFTVDGGLRGELAQGSRNLDTEKTFQHGGVFGIVDVGPADGEDKPYVVYLTSLANGSALGKITIKRDDDGDDDFAFSALPGNFVAVTQFGEQLRLDVIDLRTRTTKVFFAPGC